MQRGEDDLFINQVANENNTRVETSPDAVIRMQPVERYKDWKEEKVSYMATSRFYKGSQRWLLGLETGTRLLFYAACLGGDCIRYPQLPLVGCRVIPVTVVRPLFGTSLRHQQNSR